MSLEKDRREVKWEGTVKFGGGYVIMGGCMLWDEPGYVGLMIGWRRTFSSRFWMIIRIPCILCYYHYPKGFDCHYLQSVHLYLHHPSTMLNICWYFLSKLLLFLSSPHFSNIFTILLHYYKPSWPLCQYTLLLPCKPLVPAYKTYGSSWLWYHRHIGADGRTESQVRENGWCIYVTLCATLNWNSDLYFPSSHFHFQRPLLCLYHFSIPSSNLNPLIHFQNSICLTLNIPISYPFPIHHDRRFHSPVSDLLIPPCCTHGPALLLSVGIQTQWGRGGTSRKDWS